MKIKNKKKYVKMKRTTMECGLHGSRTTLSLTLTKSTLAKKPATFS